MFDNILDNIKDWNIEKLTGYKPKTTFYTDFSIADAFGADAITDAYKRAFEQWHNDTEYITELTMVLNWKIWEHYEKNDKYFSLCHIDTSTAGFDFSPACPANTVDVPLKITVLYKLRQNILHKNRYSARIEA